LVFVSRYVEVFEANAVDAAKAKEQEGSKGRGGLTASRRKGTSGSMVTLRGLPYRYPVL
jgi:hypothetical protein